MDSLSCTPPSWEALYRGVAWGSNAPLVEAGTERPRFTPAIAVIARTGAHPAEPGQTRRLVLAAL